MEEDLNLIFGKNRGDLIIFRQKLREEIKVETTLNEQPSETKSSKVKNDTIVNYKEVKDSIVRRIFVGLF